MIWKDISDAEIALYLHSESISLHELLNSIGNLCLISFCIINSNRV